MFFSMHNTLIYTLAIAQVLALFPVKRIFANDSSQLSFRWCSMQVLYWLIVWIGLMLFMFYTWTFTTFREPNGTLSAIANSTLLRSAGPPLVLNILLLQLAYKWPRFVRKWDLIERKMILRKTNPQLSLKIKRSTILLTIFRFAYYLLAFIMTSVRVSQCLQTKSVEQFMDTMFYVRFPQFFMFTSPAPWKHFIISFLELCAAYSWLCADLIILDLSLMLCDKFKIFNNHLRNCRTRTCSINFWMMMRQEFRKLFLLSDLTDSVLNPLIFAVVILETVNIVLLLYVMLTHSFTMLSYVYFGIVFGSHLSSDCWTLVAMATVLQESKRPLRILQQLPTSHMSIETKRLYNEVKLSTIGLSGCKFFIVTHSLSLSIISTLVTYEVLLVQLGGVKNEAYALAASNKSATFNASMAYCSWITHYLTTE